MTLVSVCVARIDDGEPVPHAEKRAVRRRVGGNPGHEAAAAREARGAVGRIEVHVLDDGVAGRVDGPQVVRARGCSDDHRRVASRRRGVSRGPERDALDEGWGPVDPVPGDADVDDRHVGGPGRVEGLRQVHLLLAVDRDDTESACPPRGRRRRDGIVPRPLRAVAEAAGDDREPQGGGKRQRDPESAHDVPSRSQVGRSYEREDVPMVVDRRRKSHRASTTTTNRAGSEAWRGAVARPTT